MFPIQDLVGRWNVPWGIFLGKGPFGSDPLREDPIGNIRRNVRGMFFRNIPMGKAINRVPTPESLIIS